MMPRTPYERLMHLPAGIYLLKWRHSGIFIVDLNIFHTVFGVSIADFEHVIAGWFVYPQSRCIHFRT